jgi:hypothetical protein
VTRKAHLVGTWPARDPEHAIESALIRLSPYLLRLNDRETGDRRNPIAAIMGKLRANPDAELGLRRAVVQGAH